MLRTEKVFRNGTNSANGGSAAENNAGRGKFRMNFVMKSELSFSSAMEMNYTTMGNGNYTTVQNGSAGVVIDGTTYTHAANGIGATGCVSRFFVFLL